MNNVERFRATLNFQPVDRLPMVEWAAWWDKTLDRWWTEGLPRGLTDYGEIQRHLGLDTFLRCRATPGGPDTPKPAAHGAGLIQDEAGYERLRPTLFPDPPRTPEFLDQRRREQATGEAIIWVAMDGFFWFPRRMFGIANHFYAFYDHPALMQRMNEDLLEYNLRALDQICQYFKPDLFTLAEDMSYNHGPMLSRDLFREFLAPYYRALAPELKKRDILFIVDSDGDPGEMIPWLEAVGVEGLLPFERQAGSDLIEVRKRHPRLRIVGGFDKMVLHQGEDAVRAEFERLLPVMRQGGFAPSVDHNTPPGVSLDEYKLYVRLLAEYCEKAAKP